EFEMKKSGTFMYHPHSDEMVQMAMGMMGMFVVHPRDPKFRRVDRDFVFVMSAYLIDPGTYLPKVAEMTDFNMWTWNSRVFPGIDPMPVRLGDRVRVRMRLGRRSKRSKGDRVRIFVTNKLPEHTTIHWHGMLLPNGMDGVGGV